MVRLVLWVGKFTLGVFGILAAAWIPFLPVRLLLIPSEHGTTANGLWTLAALVGYATLVITDRTWPYALRSERLRSATSPETYESWEPQMQYTPPPPPQKRRSMTIPLPPAWLVR